MDSAIRYPAFSRKIRNRDALEGAGVVVSVVRENQDLQVTPGLRLVTGAHRLKLVIEPAKQVIDVAVQVLGIVCGANIDVIAAVVVRVVPKIPDRFVDFDIPYVWTGYT